MKKRIVALLSAVSILICLTSCELPFKADKFEMFKEKVIYSMMGDNIGLWNAIAIDPAKLGYHRGDDVVAQLTVYKDYDITHTEDYNEVKGLLADFNEFDRNSLTDIEKEEYDAIDFQLKLLEEMVAPECKWYPMAFGYISQYGGKVADFVSTMDNYFLRKEQDVIDIIDYIKSTTEALGSYDDYARDRVEDGIPFSDYTLDKMIEYLDGVTEKGDDFYLYNLIDKKISNTKFLKSKKKVAYRKEFKEAMDTCFMPACKLLAEELEGLKGNWVNPTESYTAHYADQCEGYYQWKLRSTLGVGDIDVNQYGSEIYNLIDEAYKKYASIIEEFEDPDNPLHEQYVAMYSDSEKCFGCNNYNEIVDRLLYESAAIVYPIENCPDIVIKEEDETVGEKASYLAYYLTSPYDEKNSSQENITYNPYKPVDAANKMFTLAHEGYPGHLYSHVLEKQNDCSSFIMMNQTLGSNEGWAQYAAFSVLNAIADNTDDEIEAVVARYTAVANYCNYLNSALIDFFVNGYGLNVDQLAEAYNVDADVAQESILHYCDENIANMSCYSYGFAKILEAHERAKSNVSKYDEREFNKFIITHNGLYSLDKLEEVTNLYTQNNK